jgi:two-component system, cell cycle sensor histidine kinase and response regulator CckA
LLVEDCAEDADLILEELRVQGFEPAWRRVDSHSEYVKSLDDDFEVILADYQLPGFDGGTALKLLRERDKDVPFIVVSGSIGEERAVEVLGQGASDYLLKGRLKRLGSAIERTIETRSIQREYRRAEQALRESEQRYRQMFENNPEPMWVFDAVTYRFLDVNDAAIRKYGYSRGEFLAMTILEMVGADARPVLQELLRGDGFDQMRAFQHQKKDGAFIDVDLSSHEIVYEGRRARVVQCQDITKRRHAEEALLKNQQRTQFALSAGGIGIWDWEAKTGRAHWSETLERIHGLEPFTFGGTMAAFMERMHPQDRDAMQAEIERAIAERRDAVLDYRTLLPDGATRFIASRGRFFRNEDGEVTSAVGIASDVTERRQLEAQLNQAQKMDAIGQLAGGIAHDFNNLLTAILGYAELLAPVVKDNDRHRKDLEQIRKAGVRATRLTSQLLAFSRRQILQPVVIDLNNLVSDVASLLNRLIGEDIELSLTLEPLLGRTKADPGQIEQVIVNLAVNARDAMPAGGTLSIQTANIDVDDQFFRRHGFANESGATRFIVLSVSDTGSGIDPAVLKHIFEPFFTTKPKGKGTGLGLATVYGIVKQSGGSVWVYSEPGQGTTFKIYLPRTDQTIEIDAATTSRAPLTGSETILLVEDEEAVRLLSRALLERQGYRVLEARDAEEALRVAAAEPGVIELLVTDVVMPGPSGPELFQRLSPLRPLMRVLYLSGYTDEAIVKRGVLTEGTPFLQKPFTATALSIKVRELLDAKVVNA